MMGRVDGIVCGEDCLVGVESTVIDATGDIPVILRPGGITPQMVKDVCGDVIVDKGVDGVSSSEKPKSPGMKYKHYAPRAEVILIEGNSVNEVVERMKATAREAEGRVIVLCSDETRDSFKEFEVLCMGSRSKPETIAKNLFYAFRKCDDDGFDTIVLEGIEREGIGLAVMNRARRASNR